MSGRDALGVIAGTVRALFMDDRNQKVDYVGRQNFQDQLHFKLRGILNRDIDDAVRNQAEAVIRCFGSRQ